MITVQPLTHQGTKDENEIEDIKRII